jgi:hypothetical protein
MTGFSERGGSLLPFAGATLVTIAAAMALGGLAAGVAALVSGAARAGGPMGRRAVLGMGASVVVFVVIGAGAWSGAASGGRTEVDIKRETDAAMREFPGWNGARALDGMRVRAFEVAGESPLARRLLRPYDASFRVVLFTADNRGGSREAAIDVGDARLVSGAGVIASAVPRPEVDAHVVDPASEAPLGLQSAVRVPPGERFDGVRALFPAGVSLSEARAIEVLIDGARVEIPGRYFTLDEKRSIEASRRAPPP